MGHYNLLTVIGCLFHNICNGTCITSSWLDIKIFFNRNATNTELRSGCKPCSTRGFKTPYSWTIEVKYRNTKIQLVVTVTTLKVCKLEKGIILYQNSFVKEDVYIACYIQVRFTFPYVWYTLWMRFTLHLMNKRVQKHNSLFISSKRVIDPVHLFIVLPLAVYTCI